MTNRIARNPGFTLIELMVTLGVSALVLSIGLPGFQGLVRDNRLVMQYNQFVSELNMTRSEAVKRGIRVTMCKRNAAGTNCNNAGKWEDGWMIFTDPNNSGAVDPGEAILRVHEPLSGDNTLRTSEDLMTYNGQGLALAFNNTFRLCDIRGSRFAKAVVVSRNGRPRRAVDINGDGVVDDASGNSIPCP